MWETNKKIGLFTFFLIYLRMGCLCFGGPIAHLTNIKFHPASRSEQ